MAKFEDVFSPEVIIDLLPSVADRIELSGGTVSIVQLNDAGDGSLFDELSSDNTLKVWVPSVMLAGVNCTGLVHVVNDAVSNEHSR